MRSNWTTCSKWKPSSLPPVTPLPNRPKASPRFWRSAPQAGGCRARRHDASLETGPTGARTIPSSTDADSVESRRGIGRPKEMVNGDGTGPQMRLKLHGAASCRCATQPPLPGRSDHPIFHLRLVQLIRQNLSCEARMRVLRHLVQRIMPHAWPERISFKPDLAAGDLVDVSFLLPHRMQRDRHAVGGDVDRFHLELVPARIGSGVGTLPFPSVA